MCQVSAFVKQGEKEELLKENVTSMELLEKGIRVSTLFDGPAEYRELQLRFIDFSGGRVILEKQK